MADPMEILLANINESTIPSPVPFAISQGLKKFYTFKNASVEDLVENNFPKTLGIWKSSFSEILEANQRIENGECIKCDCPYSGYCIEYDKAYVIFGRKWSRDYYMGCHCGHAIMHYPEIMEGVWHNII